jgi:hypothetical protein
MEDSFIICFDFFRIREKYDPSDEFSEEYAVEFMLESSGLIGEMVELFPNKTVDLSNNTFFLRSEMTAEDLLELLSGKFLTQMDIRDSSHILKQIYVAKIDDFKFRSFRDKELEIAYLVGKKDKID